ncbi:MAG: leucine-rich repeat protein, partial [Oscillospiraceae bacterium]|nr:leucine-rich repeat protein [Oscillospiraceae bacterium]
MKKTSKTLLTMLLCLILCTVLLNGQARAADVVASGDCGADGNNLTWTLDSDGVLTISGTGAMADYNGNARPWADYMSAITSVVLEDGVTSIGRYGFCDCSGLTSVTIPEGITVIGNYAFYCCNSLKDVAIPSTVSEIGLSTFSTQMTVHITDLNAWFDINFRTSINGGGPFIGKYRLFLNENEITSVTIPSRLAAIKPRVFYNCSSLTSVTIPEGVTSIGDGVFAGCSNLASVTIPCSVTSIGHDAFASCKALTEITLPAGITSIKSYTFSACTGLTHVTIPEGVTSIGEGAFAGCSNLASVTIPSSVTNISNYSFNNCTAMTDVYYGGTADQWAEITIGIQNDPLTTATIHTIVASGECGADGDNLTWTLDSDGLLTISGTGAMADNTSAPLPWYEHRTSVTTVMLEEGVTSIGNGAFYGCSGLTSVTIPGSVTSIGDAAFRDCKGLTSVTIPEGVVSIGNYVFRNCSGLTSVMIPGSLTSIGDSAFYICKGLTSAGPVGSGSSIEFGWTNSIPANAFRNCSGLTSVTIPAGVTSIGNYALYKCSNLTSVTIPNSVTRIGGSVFSGCTNLSSATIPESVIDKGFADVFSDCNNLTCIVIADGTTCIRDEAFPNCSGLTSVSIPGSVTSIGNSAFSGCSGLTSMTIPGSVTSIGVNAFYGCSSLTSVTIPEGVTSIGNSAFYGCSGLTSVTIPASVTSIAFHAFENCRGLTSAGPIGSGCSFEFGWTTSIPANAFFWCGWLTSVTIPEGVTSIGEYAFYCSSLTNVTIPASVTSIGYWAFRGCSSLSRVTIPGSVTSFGEGAFSSCSGLTSAGPIGSGCDYEFGWTTSIPAYAFDGCGGLKSVTIPDGVTSIGEYAFNTCSSLTSVTIPESVTSIRNSAFNGCTALSEVYFLGSRAQWDAISIGSGNDPLNNANVCIAFVASGECGAQGDNLTWTLDENGLLTISGTGDMADYEWENPPWYNRNYMITSAILEDTVTSIGYHAFFNCYKLTSVTIPASVTSIGDRAFEVCSSLKIVTIPASVTSIGSYAFSYCSGLRSVTIPNRVLSKGFRNVFTERNNLRTVVILEGAESIPNDTFSDCSGLTSVTIPGTVTSIGDRAFYGCSGLTSVTIPENVISIGGGAFRGCSGLTSVSIPKSVTSIGETAFSSCDGLAEINVTSENPNYSSLDGVLFNIDMTLLLCCPAGKTGEYSIPTSVTSIGDSAFLGCSRLTGVTIPESVTSIGDEAFQYCRGLTSLAIPESVTSIGKGAFYGCSNLASVTIPISVTRIAGGAFCDCSSLTSVTIPGSVTSIGSSAFSGCSKLSHVYYGGTQAEWDEVSIGSDNAPLQNAQLHYHEHSCDALVWTWAADHSSASAAGTCSECGKDFTINAVITSVTNEATCTSAGQIVYTATVTFGGNTCTDKKIVEIPATGHAWGAVNYVWCADNGSVTATRACANDPSHVETETVQTTRSVKIPATCTAAGEAEYTAVFENTAFEKQTKAEEIPATGHAWGAVNYVWSADNGSVTATRACANDPSHVETETVQTTRSVKTPATCIAAGEAEYTAVFENTAFEKQTKAEEIPATGHAWGAVNYEWSADNGSVTATRACANDPNHVETETVRTTRSVKIPATCTAAGEAEYTAAFENTAFETQTKTEEIPKLPHSYGEPIWTWSDGYDTALALFSCGQCGDIRTVQASITCVGVDPTCAEAGETVYTASVEFGGEIYTNQKTKTIPALGHTPGEVVREKEVAATCTAAGSYDEVTYCTVCGEELSREKKTIPAMGHNWSAVQYVWAEDNTSVTATRVCGNDPSHVETEMVQTTSSVKTPATCTAAGEVEYTAVFENTAFEKQTKTEEIPKLPHDYGEPEWAWVANHTTAMAIFTCESCGDSQTVRASITMSTKEASCTQTGAKIYTASVTFGGETYTDEQTEEIPATGHTPGDPVRENEKTATCAAEGSYDEVTYCMVCGEELSRTTKTIDKLPHTPGEPVREKEVAATCTAAGSYDEVTYCTVCHEELSRETKTIDKLPHTPGEPVREKEVAATCTAAGSYDEVTYCTVCHEELSRETKTIDKLPHTPGEPVRENEVAATCAAAGSYDEVTYCTVCHEELSRTTKTIDKLPHTPGDPVREKEVAATCAAEGSYDEITYCTVCGEELSRTTKTIDKLPHTPGEPVRENEIPATTEAEGSYDEVVYCECCGEELSREHKTIEKLIEPVVITTQPANQSVTAGETATFSVAASGTGLSYQWQYSKDGSTWTNKSGATAASYTVTAKTSYNGMHYRCKVTNEGGSVYSDPATLTVTVAKPVITTQPANQSVTAGAAATFSIAASGTGLSYQWQYSKDGSTWTNKSGA